MKTSVLRMARMSAYAALTVGVIVLTIILVAIGRGYFFDFRTGQVEGGGLILLNSLPEGAKVLVNSQEISKNTPSRLGVRAGNYDLELTKPGFRSWRKQVAVVTSEVSWVQYPLLVPTELTPTAQADLPAVTSSAQSPDRKYIAYSSSAPPRVVLFEPGKSELRVVYGLSPEQLANGASIESITWANDAQHLLITLRQKGQANYIVVNALNPAELSDLTHDFGADFNGLQFSARNWRELYWLSPEGLRRLDLANRTLSAVLAANVQSFTVSPEAIFYIQTSGGQQQLMRLERDQPRTLAANLPVSDYQVVYMSFENKTVLALADKPAGRLRLFHTTSERQSLANPYEHLPTSQLLLSPDQRYLVMHSGRQFVTYSLEFGRLHHFELPTDQYGPLSWLGNYHLLTNINGTLHLSEFDGGNQLDLMAAQAGLTAYGDADRQFIYSVGSSGGVSQLQAVDLRP